MPNEVSKLSKMVSGLIAGSLSLPVSRTELNYNACRVWAQYIIYIEYMLLHDTSKVIINFECLSQWLPTLSSGGPIIMLDGELLWIS